MGRRPTIADLARESGVSIATVDRVLNGRHRVREETALRVYDAAHRIGYHAANVIRQRMLADQPEYRLGFIFHKEKHAFHQHFASAIEETARTMSSVRIRMTIQFAASQTPGEVADQLAAMVGRVQAVAATGLDHHQVTSAVSMLRDRGIPTFSLLSDYAQSVRECYVGLNNLKVGRTVGWLLTKIAPRPGKVAVFVGGHRFHGHELRETGFRSYVREYAPDFDVLETLTNLETRQVTYEATLDLLSRHPDLVGFYCAGGGMEGAIAALREVRRPEEVTAIVNELTPESRGGLLDRYLAAAIATPLPRLCSELVGLMINTIDNGFAEVPGQRFLPAEIWVSESL